MKKMQTKALKCVQKYLETVGYEIIEIEPTEHIDIVAKENDTLCFIHVRALIGKFSEATPSREQMENEAAEYLKGVKVEDQNLRFDVVSLNVIANDQAMIRHHINAFPDKIDKLDILLQLLEDGEITESAYETLKEVLS